MCLSSKQGENNGLLRAATVDELRNLISDFLQQYDSKICADFEQSEVEKIRTGVLDYRFSASYNGDKDVIVR